MFYHTVYYWVKSAIYLFFHKITTHGLSNIPNNKPVILAANHQNALLDALVIAICVKKPVHFMTRADLFKNKIVSKLLRSLNLIPIYRMRDGFKELANNDQTFQECYNLLSQNKIILIFPEGSHLSERRLRPLKKGVSRIALEATYSIKKDVFIIPVGINYGSHTQSGSWLNITLDSPISTLETLKQHNENKAKTILHLTELTYRKLQICIVHIEDTTNYELIQTFYEINKHKSSKNQNVIYQKEWVKNFNQLEQKKRDYILLKTKEYLDLWKSLAFPLKSIGKLNRTISFTNLFFTFLNSIACFVLYPPKIGFKLLFKKFKDKQWEASIKVLSIMVFYPIWILCIVVLCSIFFTEYIIPIMLTLILLIFAYKISHHKTLDLIFYIRLLSTKQKSEITYLKQIESELKKINITE